jgi:hypothetical protein
MSRAQREQVDLVTQLRQDVCRHVHFDLDLCARVNAARDGRSRSNAEMSCRCVIACPPRARSVRSSIHLPRRHRSRQRPRALHRPCGGARRRPSGDDDRRCRGNRALAVPPGGLSARGKPRLPRSGSCMTINPRPARRCAGVARVEGREVDAQRSPLCDGCPVRAASRTRRWPRPA